MAECENPICDREACTDRIRNRFRVYLCAECTVAWDMALADKRLKQAEKALKGSTKLLRRINNCFQYTIGNGDIGHLDVQEQIQKCEKLLGE